MTSCGFEIQEDKQAVEQQGGKSDDEKPTTNILTGADRTDQYLDRIKGKRVAIVGNQTSLIAGKHLVDTLLSLGVQVKKVFAPEHGFRGTADAGEHIDHSKDARTGLLVISLYGKNKKPTAEQLKDLDVVLFDIQDMGVRFYTYISTLHYVMEACAESGKEIIVLDRPNPHDNYVDGPVLKSGYESFVGMHPVPVVYGMTIGEYAQMIRGESWLKTDKKSLLTIISCSGYERKMAYELPVAPSPNLKSHEARILYPSLCFFEATHVSVGRGTERPFELFGHPDFPPGTFQFKPESTTGSKHPKWEGKTCYGYDLHDSLSSVQNRLHLSWLIQARDLLKGNEFLKNPRFLDLLAGTDELRKQLLEGKTEADIRKSWQDDLRSFIKLREKYLIYE